MESVETAARLSHYADTALLCIPLMQLLQFIMLPCAFAAFLFTIYSGLQLPSVLLTTCLCLLTFALMKWNSLSVIQELAYQRENVLKQNNEQLQRKLRVQARRLALLQGAAEE